MSLIAQAIWFAVVGLIKECVTPASNKTLVGKVFIGNILDTREDPHFLLQLLSKTLLFQLEAS